LLELFFPGIPLAIFEMVKPEEEVNDEWDPLVLDEPLTALGWLTKPNDRDPPPFAVVVMCA